MGKKDMTQVLRQLAEQGETPGSKARAVSLTSYRVLFADEQQRRPRSSTNRGKVSEAHSSNLQADEKTSSNTRTRTASTSTSPHKQHTPDIFDAPSPPHQENMGVVNEETIRVSYIDSDAEKARKKLLDAVRKSDRKAETSPKNKGQSQGRRESPRTKV